MDKLPECQDAKLRQYMVFWAKWKNDMYGGKLTSPRTHKRIMLWFSELETVKLLRVLTILKEIRVSKL